MINRNGQINLGHQKPVQQTLFDNPINFIHDPGPALKSAMREAEENAKQKYYLSRDNIIDAMNAMAEQANITCNGNARKITLHIYAKWLSTSNLHHIPLRWLPIFCRAVRSNLPLAVYTSYFKSVHLMDDEDLKKLQWANVEIEKRKLSKQSRKLAGEVGI